MIIDVSHHNGLIDWNVAGKYIDYAILRCGFGSNQPSHIDKQFNYNATQCEKYGIPYGVYLYSYARNFSNCKSEIKHILTRVKNRTITYPLYYDIEENSTFETGEAKNFAAYFVSAIRRNGYKAGLYSCDSSFKQYFNSLECDSKWVARYSSFPPNSNFDLWQYSSKNLVAGIKGCVDASVPLYNSIFSKESYDRYVDEVIDGKYGNGKERKDNLVRLGLNYHRIQCLVNQRICRGRTNGI